MDTKPETEKPERKRPLARPKRKWDGNIETNFKETA
jgi:hypothetical protein